MLDNLLNALIRNKPWLIRTLVFIDCVVIVLVAVSGFWPRYWYQLASKAGNLSVLFLVLTLLPGILARFSVDGGFLADGWLLKIRVLLMSLRRYFGINMYLFGFFHYLWLRVLPSMLLSRGSMLAKNLFEVFGWLVLLVGLPLFLTSNDWSVKKLGRLWKRLQNFVFLMMLFLIGHLLLLSQLEPITILLIVLTFAELTSWFFYWRKKKA
ncbi:MAG: hypothetical protein ACOZAN_00105 [Patescibacteria group bacterium]